MTSQTPYREIRALYDDTTITVYQAYKAAIADAAVSSQKLNASPEFHPGRMTWIKPSWCWMMYRAGYSYKDAGQSRILALHMPKDKFLGLLERGVLSSHAQKTEEGEKKGKTADVRIQWDPERSPALDVYPYRSIQIGIPGALSDTWANEWIAEIEDVTQKARELKKKLDEDPDVSVGELVKLGLMPEERPFGIPQHIRDRLDMDIGQP